jgi:hypothetical protein
MPHAPLLALAGALAALPALAAAGPEITPVPLTGPFQKVESRGDFDVQVREGAPASVEIVAEPGMAERIQVEVSGGELRLSRKSPHGSAKGVIVRVVVPELRGLAVGGSGTGTAETGPAPRDLRLAVSGSGHLDWKGTASALDLAVSGSGSLEARGDTGKASVAISGSGDAKLQGRGESLEVRISGSGELDARQFPVKDASVAIAGSGDAELQLAGGTLSAQIAGSGDVLWSGEGKLGAVATAGSGRVKRR